MNRSRVLVVWPPSVPTYFNAGHRLPIWEVARYLRGALPDSQVDALDAGVLNFNWKEMADTLASRYDVVAIVNEFDNVDGVRRVAEYARALSPSSRLLTFGRASGRIPRFFRRYPLDAIVCEGDFELGVLQFVRAVRYGTGLDQAGRGLMVKWGETWVTGSGDDLFIDPAEWAFADPEELPLDAYARLSARPENRFSALPGKRELSIAVARGCPVGCDYCLVPAYQGLRERRRPVHGVIAYLLDAMRQTTFDYVSMYAPTFTLNRPWVREFCVSVSPLGVPWKCCTSVHHLDEELVRTMGAAGCMRISVGLETLDPASKRTLPRVKRKEDADLEALARWCLASNIELNCFVMLGMPGQSHAGLQHTFAVAKAVGAKVRPTIYTPYHQLTDDISEADLMSFFTRHLRPSLEVGGLDAEELYSMAFGSDIAP